MRPNFKSELVGRPAPQPIVKTQRNSTSMAKFLSTLIPSLVPDSAAMLVAGVGSGKTTCTLREVLNLCLQDNSISVCFVSSRCAINSQMKRKIARQLKCEHDLDCYNEIGLQQLKQIGPVTILTYHALYSMIREGDSRLQDVDFFIFDEVHSLVQDATFVSFTGELLRDLPRFFSSAKRIYLSATPEPILAHLAKVESQPIHVLRFPSHYPQWKPIFYADESILLQHLHSIPKTEKALIFVPSISAGRSLSSKFDSAQLITARTKLENPQKWQELLSAQELSARYTFSTSTIDAGVSLTDPALRHIVCSSIDPVEVIQQAGRRRLKSGETLSVYIPLPSQQQLWLQLSRLEETLSILRTTSNNQSLFISKYVLEEDRTDIRQLCYWKDGKILPNYLAIASLDRQAQNIRHLINAKSPYILGRTIYHALGLSLPADNKFIYLKHRSDGEISAFQDWLHAQVGEISEKDSFSETFKTQYQNCFGARKNDRSDRSWGLSVIKKVLSTLNWGFSIEAKRSIWVLSDLRTHFEGGEKIG